MPVLAMAILLAMCPRAESADLEITLALPDDRAAPWVALLTSIFETQVTSALDGSSTPVYWHHLTIGSNDEPGASFELVRSGEAQIAMASVTRHPWSLYPLALSYVTPFSCNKPAVVATTIDNLNTLFTALDLAWASLNLIYLGLAKDAPLGRLVQLCGRIVAVPKLGGLHHAYVRT